MVTDYYSASAEFYELVAARRVRTSAGPLITALSGVDASHGPVVEIGAARRIPPFRMLRERIGEQSYGWWTEADPVGGAVMRWRMSWKVFRDGELVRSASDSYDWENLSSNSSRLRRG
ncbi:hypothetical protein [Streptomyces marincola]|uniref:hypothetical protein n=1 Tax=Streptomyces marincola TaxID=2878388 RepID=UPI0020FFF6FF|nr:hypothetical protein [Streptomyces marincola]